MCVLVSMCTCTHSLRSCVHACRMSRVCAALCVPIGAIAYREYRNANKNITCRSFSEILSRPEICLQTRIYRFVRPIIFAIPPETAHISTIWLGSCIGELARPVGMLIGGVRCLTARIADLCVGPSKISNCATPNLSSVRFCGIDFAYILGISAGFDKNAKLVKFFDTLVGRWNCFPIGHVEYGSVSYIPWAGNVKPRLFRLESDFALINRMGLNNEGAVVVADRVAQIREKSIPSGINITKTPDSKIEENFAIEDFTTCFKFFQNNQPKWITLNVSCPNTAEGKTFEDLEALSLLLDSLANTSEQTNEHLKKKPALLLKLAPLPPKLNSHWEQEYTEIILLAKSKGVDGLVIANTVPDRAMPLLNADVAEQKGGLSGKPIFNRSTPLIRLANSLGMPVIASGGISSANDAYQMLKAGATLCQIYTAMVYDGPGIFTDIQNGLERLFLIYGRPTHASEASVWAGTSNMSNASV